MQYLKIMACAALSLALVACGGGGGSAGTPTGGTGGTGGGITPPSTVASFTISLDKSALTNSGSDKVVVTVQAVDANHNPVAAAKVTGSVDTGVFTPVGTATDTSGNFVGNVTIAADKTNRNITLSITVNAITQKIIIPVSGGQITITPVPATPAPGQAVTLNLQVQDVLGKGIANVPVTLSGTAGFSGTTNTDSNGNLLVSGPAPASAASYTVSASASGLTATTTIQVVDTGGNTIPAAVLVDYQGNAITIGQVAASLTANPTSIGTNATGVTTNRASLSAKFVAPGNVGIQNMRVRFDIVPPALGSGEFISTGVATVYSKVDGSATADYVAGTRSSPTNGVLLRACYAATDAALAATGASAPPCVTATMTVQGQPLAIAIVNQNTMTKDGSGLFYQEPFGIQVADSSGVAVPGARVTVSVDITHYGKGVWNNHYPVLTPDLNFGYATVLAPNPPGGLSGYYWLGCTTKDASGNILPSCLTDRSPVTNNPVYTDDIPPDAWNNVWCQNEDINRNGTLDAGEDINGNVVLDPSKSEIVLSYVNGNVTDANGRLLIQASYGQNMGGWLAYTIKATTSVVGSEGTKSRSFVTSVLQADVPNGAFLTPPYGSGRCIDPH